MEPVFFVMAILGCGDVSAVCQEARVEPARYDTLDACRAAQPAALERSTDLDFPEIATRCRASGVRIAAATPRPRG